MVNDIEKQTYKYTSIFFKDYYKIFDNLNIYDELLSKCYEAIISTFKNENIISDYIKIIEIIDLYFNNNEDLIHKVNNQCKNGNNIELLLVNYISNNIKTLNFKCLKFIELIDVEIFEEYYKKKFSQRLLKHKNIHENDYKLINNFKLHNLDFVSILNKMIKDIDYSNSIKSDINLLVDNSTELKVNFIIKFVAL